MREILIDNDYYIKIEKTDCGCKVTYPKNIIKPPIYDECINNYTIDGNVLLLENKKIDIEKFAFRPFILIDIFFKSSYKGIHKTTINFEDNEVSNKNILQLVENYLSEEESQKEKTLMQCILQNVNHESIEEEDVKSHYIKLINLALKGDFDV